MENVSLKDQIACKDEQQEPEVIYISKDTARVELTLTDEQGKYAVDVTVHDKVKDVHFKLYRALEVKGSAVVQKPVEKKQVHIPIEVPADKPVPSPAESTTPAPSQYPGGPYGGGRPPR